MTVYKALGKYINSDSTLQSSMSNLNFYPSYSLQSDDENFCIYNIVQDFTEPIMSGGFPTGEIRVQFDFHSKVLSTLDTLVGNFKSHFVGKSFDLDTSVTMGYCDSSNEMSAYDDDEKFYIRSVDLRINYIIN